MNCYHLTWCQKLSAEPTKIEPGTFDLDQTLYPLVRRAVKLFL